MRIDLKDTKKDVTKETEDRKKWQRDLEKWFVATAVDDDAMKRQRIPQAHHVRADVNASMFRGHALARCGSHRLRCCLRHAPPALWPIIGFSRFR